MSHARFLGCQEIGLALHSEKITKAASGIHTKWEKNKDRWLENLQQYNREKKPKTQVQAEVLIKRKKIALSDIIQLSGNNN